MLLAKDSHKNLAKEVEKFQKELETFLVAFSIGYATATKLHSIKDSQATEVKLAIEKLQQSLNILIDTDIISKDGKNNEYIWIKYDCPFFPIKTYYFRHTLGQSYEDFTEKTFAGVLSKYLADIATSTAILDTLSGTNEFSNYRKRLQKLLDDFLLN